MNDGGARGPRPAGFWIRLAAMFVDAVVIALGQISLGLVARRVWGGEIDDLVVYQGFAAFFTVLFACAYTTVTHAATGQTIGKALVGARVVAVDGQLLPVGAALLRWLALSVSALPLGMGFVMAGLRVDKRALHDLIAGSRVERVARVERPGRTSAAAPREREAEAVAWPPEAGTRLGPPPTAPPVEDPPASGVTPPGV